MLIKINLLHIGCEYWLNKSHRSHTSIPKKSIHFRNEIPQKQYFFGMHSKNINTFLDLIPKMYNFAHHLSII